MFLSRHRLIPENELNFTFARSSGAGGQNVNKTSTKVMVSWSVDRSRAFTLEEKERIKKQLISRLNNHKEIMVTSEVDRTQLRNRYLAIKRLNEIVSKALLVRKKRCVTKPTYASKLKRLDHKKNRSKLKRSRRIVSD